MSERQNVMPKDRKQKLFRMSTGCQKDRKTGWQTDGQTDRQIERQNDFSA